MASYIRVANMEDLGFLDGLDPLLRRPILTEKVRQGEVYVAEVEGERVGLARYQFFWDLDPFLTLIYVREAFRRQGIGTRLMEFWEQQMREEGHRVLLTSTQADESAQFFYRALGFADSGSILFPGQAATELVLIKQLRGFAPGPSPREK